MPVISDTCTELTLPTLSSVNIRGLCTSHISRSGGGGCTCGYCAPCFGTVFLHFEQCPVSDYLGPSMGLFRGLIYFLIFQKIIMIHWHYKGDFLVFLWGDGNVPSNKGKHFVVFLVSHFMTSVVYTIFHIHDLPGLLGFRETLNMLTLF